MHTEIFFNKSSRNVIFASLLILLITQSAAATPEDDFKDCLCQCRCMNAMGFRCYTGNQVCKYDVPASICGEDRAAEDNAVCSCYSPELCYRVALEPSDSECYADCLEWYNQAVSTPQEPETACGDGVCSSDESAGSCPEDCAPKEENVEKCENDVDDDNDKLADCFDTEDCKCSQTVWLTVAYNGENNKPTPVAGATVTFNYTDGTGLWHAVSATTDKEGKANAKLDKLWEGDGRVVYKITLVDQAFKFMKDHNNLYEISGSFKIKNVKDLNQDDPPMFVTDRIALRMWDRLHEVYDFYTKVIKTNVDYQMPEEIYIQPFTDGGAFHSYDSNTRKEDMGITFQSMVFSRGVGESASPQNCEWHEFNHHAMMAVYKGMWDSKRIENHGGWINPTSDDSYIEGFAEFMSLVETKYYADKYPRLAKYPSVYYWSKTASNLEKNFNIRDDEEFAVASILWDLYDPHSMSLVDKDHIQIDRETLWRVLSSQHKFSDGQTRYIHNTRDLYEAVKALNDPQFENKYTDYFEPRDDAWMDELGALDKIFVAHGAYWDKNNNSILDENEEIGYTPGFNDFTTRRTDKELPPGSYILANINNGEILNGTAKVKVIHEGEYSYLDYEYEADFSDGLIGIDPPYDVPTTWEIRVTSDGYAESAPITLTSEDYNSKYDPTKEYFESKDFTVMKAGWSGGEEGYTPETPGGGIPSENEACCMPMFLLAGLAGSVLLFSFEKKLEGI